MGRNHRTVSPRAAESGARYDTLLDAIDQGFCVCEMLVDADGKPVDYRFLEVNRLFSQFTGLENATGRTARELVPNLEMQWVRAYAQAALARESTRFELASTAMGRVFYVHAFPIGHAADRTFGILFTETTLRAQAEEENERLLHLLREERARLEASEERYRAIVESQSELVCRFRPEGVILFANTAYARARSTTPERLVGETFWQFVEESDRPAVRAVLAGLTPSNREVRIENRFETGDGVKWTLWTNRALAFNEAGQAIEVQATGIDITDRKQREQHADFLAQISATLARAADDEQIMTAVAERLGGHLNASRCIFTEYDAGRTVARVIHDWSRAPAPSMEGAYQIRQFLSDEALDVLAAGEMLVVHDIATDPRTQAGRAQYAAFGVGAMLNMPYVREGQWTASLTILRSEPTTWRADEMSLLRDLSSRVWASIERARADRRLRTSEAELREASQMKDEFLATLSHELRTPLNAVLGWAHLLRSANLAPDVARRGFDALERNARVQSQLVDDLLDMSRIVSGKLQIVTAPVSLQQVVAAAVETVRPSAVAKSVALGVTSDSADDYVVNGDADRLRQVVWNLLSNAVKFTPAGGAVDVALHRVGASVQVSVHDTGEGIDPDFLPVVFDRFRQADGTTTRRHGGLGLGLAIVRHLTEAHGGTVTAASDGANRGATFTLRFPTLAAAPTSPSPVQSFRLLPLTGTRILVVDDQIDAVELFRVALESRGAHVSTALSADDAIDQLQQTPCDVLLADIGMPERDGFWLIRALRASGGPNAKVPAIAVTAYASVSERQKALAAGYQRHLAKPVDHKLMVETISELLQRTSRLTPG